MTQGSGLNAPARGGWFDRLFPEQRAPGLSDFTTTRRVLPIAFLALCIGVLSGFVAGVAGILHGLSYQLVVPELFVLDQILLAVLLIVLAGRGNLLAPTIGGVVYVLIYEAAPIDGEYRQGLLGLIVVLIVILVPGGIAGGTTQVFKRVTARRRRQSAGAVTPNSASSVESRRVDHGA